VVECGPHENADKLSVCEVDTGDGENHSIVCGAPNVKSGIYVPVAKVGATLNNGDFKIKQAKLRGVESHGMICSERELSISDEHEGIMILDTEADLGTPIEEILTFKEDTLFEIDLTPNRGDCLSHLGVARELGINAEVDIKRRAVDVAESENPTSNEIKIDIADKDACPRYVARVIKGVKVGPSPQWLVDRMTSIGQSSINNIVDAANYVLMDSGHPMHTFDFDTISGNEIIVRYAENGEKFTTLDNEKRDLKDFHLLICDGETPIALAGIMGGANSEITDRTTNILIESAYFSPTVVRKGAKVLDLSTEASKRFERDTDMDGIIPAINQLATLIVEVAGGEICKGVVDEYPAEKIPHTFNFSLEKCEALLGTHITEKKIETIFDSLQITYKNKNGSFQCTIPTFRNDLEREVDLYEEVARVIGYDNIPSAVQFTGSYNSFVEDDQQLDSLLRTHLQYNGYYEHYSNSLQHENDTNLFLGGEAVELKNPLSQDMAFIRNSIIPGLLMAASYNEKRQEKGFKLFEIGAIHNQSKKSATGSKEKFHLGLLWYGEPQSHWRNYEDRDLYRCKGEIVQLLESVGLSNISYKVGTEKGFETSLKIYSGKTQIGNVGILDNKVLKQYDIKVNPTVCDLSLHNMRTLWQNRKLGYSPPPAYPSMNRDIALQVSRDKPAEDLLTTIQKEGGNTLKDVSLFDVYQSDEVGDNNKSLAFSLKFQSEATTLTDTEVDADVEKILNSLKKAHGAIQR
ncbi:uncharacterized protein METZ01_LOCUS3453, partial [marine metagenome]